MATQAKIASKKKANGKWQMKTAKEKANIFVIFFRSGGEENERQMENKVNAKVSVESVGTW